VASQGPAWRSGHPAGSWGSRPQSVAEVHDHGSLLAGLGAVNVGQGAQRTAIKERGREGAHASVASETAQRCNGAKCANDPVPSLIRFTPHLNPTCIWRVRRRS